ncbi:related to NOP14 - nuclear and nucleolar protein with possible role in ribosome biogenesis [Ustilago trichophora]|uniref:Related to NOP14 - nuclear and nucleolar protein with possible role in ribosome biogenesis n=1 Tax=Ustilago trichophora TaxID=86804 RepID=A0A5C3DTK3_9BASI|nr:related to NOP14 - nuclear and nucleolar protein with possible role in ribosome biogenesis [Ustilago trichophora]
MAKGGGSQLSQLKSKLHSSGVTDRRQLSKKSRSRKGGQDEKDAAAARLNKINSIVSGLNPFDQKVTKPKHEVLGRKIKGAVGRPGAAKASGLAQRRETLLPEWQARNRTGTFVDRRFGENDANMTPEEKMLERFATEKQRRAAKGAAFNLNDDDELLTHYGQSLSGLDDLADIRLPEDDDDDEDPGRLTAQGHFGGFGDNEDGDKSKADVMREVIAKSKFHKLERQKMKDADDELREQLDDELADIRGLLFEQAPVPTPAPAVDPKAKAKISVFPGPATGANATAVAGASTSAAEGEEKPASSYDTFVRELAFERRAKPQDRLKSEEELAAEEAQRLMKAEKARLKRMRGDSDDEGEDEEDEGGRRKRKKGANSSSGPKRAAQADDLDDDFELDGMTAGEVYGLGAGLAESGAVDESDDEEEDDEDQDGDEEEDDDEDGEGGEDEDEDEDDEDDEDDFADLADADDAIQIGEDEESEQEGDHEALTGTSRAGSSGKGSKAGSSGKAKAAPVTESKLPFTFPCPATHDELLSLLENHQIDPKHIPTVIKRIRTLHHPSLAEDNKYRLQAFIGVLIDHALHWAGQAQLHQSNTGQKHKLAFAIVNSLIPHIFSLSQNYPAASAEHFVSKLALMQRNLSRALAKGPTDADARTWPGLPELTLLRLVGSVWPTSDKQHNVTTPLALLIAQYLGHARIRSISDMASGLFLCSLVVSNEKESKRLFPEALNFLFSAIAILASLGGGKKQRDGLAKIRGVAEEYGIPTPDVDAAHTRHLRLAGEDAVEPASQAVDLPSLITAKSSSADSQQQCTELLSVALALTSNFSDLYNGSTSYVELFTPFSVLLSTSPSTSTSSIASSLTRSLNLAISSRRYLRLQAHRAIAIASHVPKFDQQGYNPDRKSALDPDVERVQIQKMKALIKKERKGAIRELRRDNQFIAEVRRQDQAEEDRTYKKKMDKIMSTLQVERSEQKQLERAKANIKRRAGKK